MKTRLLLLSLLCVSCTPDRWYGQPRAESGADKRRAVEAEDAEAAGTAAIQAPLAPELPALDAEGRLPLRVEDAVLLAVAWNRDLRVRRYENTIAATFEEIERGRYDPEIYAGLSYGEDRRSETSNSTGDRFDVDSETVEAEIGLRQELPSGTDIDIGISQSGETSSRSPDQEESRIGLTVTQALLRGRGPAVNMADIRKAALEADISRYELRAYVEALIAETEKAYWRLARSERQLAVVRESLRIAALQRDDIAARIELGGMPRSAAAATRSELARRRQALIEVESQRQQALLRLQRLVTPAEHLDFEQALALDSDPVIEPADLGQVTEHISLALQKRPELGEARLRLEQRRLACVVTANGTLPRLDFFVGLGKSGYGESISDALADLDGEGYDLEVGLDFSWSLGDRSAAARKVAAIASQQQAQAAIDNLEQLVELELRLAWNEVDRAARQLAASQLAAELQAETLRAEQELLAAGAGTTLAVAQAQRDLLEAQVAVVTSAAAYRIALVELYRAEGTLIERRGIRVLE